MLKKNQKIKAALPKANKPRKNTLAAGWAELFLANETRVKAGQKGWTDAELVAKMEKSFPESKGKSTLSRVSMVRACYNKGSNMFKAAGAAGKGSRPIAKCYNPEKTSTKDKPAKASKVVKPANKVLKNPKITTKTLAPTISLKKKTAVKSVKPKIKAEVVESDEPELVTE